MSCSALMYTLPHTDSGSLQQPVFGSSPLSDLTPADPLGPTAGAMPLSVPTEPDSYRDMMAKAFTGTARFQIVDVLGSGGMGVVYEALDTEHGSRVALKTLRALDPRAILQLKQEFRSLQDLAHPNLLRLGELHEEAGCWFFTMELVDGDDFLGYVRADASKLQSGQGLYELLTQASQATQTSGADRTVRELSFGPPLTEGAGDSEAHAREPGTSPQISVDTDRLRRAMIQLAHGLEYLHTAGKVHLDIKPSNVMVTREGRVVILDFGITRDMTPGHGRAYHPIAGTVSFMSPEQIQSKELGPASDWYSVGVMLYLALTGHLPYPGTTLQIMDAKLSRLLPQAPEALTRSIPPIWSALCMDLLQPEPKARPTAREVLRRLGADEVPPDVGGPALPKPVFVGRDQELAALGSAYERVSSGQPACVLIHGDSGVGKSALVRRFLAARLADEPEILILGDRCYERECVPYKAVDEVLDSLARHLAAMSEGAHLPDLPDGMDALATLFPVLQNVPGIVPVATRPSEIGDVQQLRVRAFRALKLLLGWLCRLGQVILVIDDLQWSDEDSLSLLAELFAPPNAPGVLFIGTVRPSAAGKGRSVEDLSARLSGEVRLLGLGPLPYHEAYALAQALSAQGTRRDEDELTRVVLDTGGHPMFIDALMRHHQSSARTAHAHLDDVLWEHICQLTAVERQIVEAVAVAGPPIAQEAVAHAVGLSPGALFDLLLPLRAGKLVRTGGVRTTQAIEPYHTRVREAVLARLTPEAQAEWHRKLALALERMQPEPEPELLALHWDGCGNAAKAFDYMTRAAASAAAALAFDRAASLYRRALALMPASLWQEDYERALALFCDAARAALMSGDSAWMETICRTAETRAVTVMDRARIYELRIAAAITANDLVGAIDLAHVILADLGVRLPRRATLVHALSRMAWTTWRLWRRDIGELASLPMVRDPVKEAAMRLLLDVMPATYIGFPALHMYLSLLLVELTIEHGTSSSSATGYAMYALIYTALTGSMDRGIELGRLSMTLAQALGTREELPKIELVLVMGVRHWSEPLRALEGALRDNWRRALAQANFEFAGYSGCVGYYYALFAGFRLGEIHERYAEFVHQLSSFSQDQTAVPMAIWRQAIASLESSGDAPPTLSGRWFRIERDLTVQARKCNYHALLYAQLAEAMLAVIARDPARAGSALSAGKEYLQSLKGTVIEAMYCFYEHLVLLDRAARAGALRGRALRERASLGLWRLAKWARLAPSTYAHKWEMLEALRLSGQGQAALAEAHFGRAVQGALEHGFVHEAALACELLSEHHARRQSHRRAAMTLARARDLYAEWGALAKVSALNQRL